MRKLLEQNKENHHCRNRKRRSSISNNSYLCINEEELSEILNERDVLVEEDLTQSVSSLSINSYEGDSLVFETERMRFEQVKETCSTFDILLFKNKSLMSKVQRIFTNSDYDHTALLLKTTSNDLLMLEATSNSGVAIYTFNSLLKIDRSKYFQRYHFVVSIIIESVCVGIRVTRTWLRSHSWRISFARRWVKSTSSTRCI